jgi:hypothetical protein
LLFSIAVRSRSLGQAARELLMCPRKKHSEQIPTALPLAHMLQREHIADVGLDCGRTLALDFGLRRGRGRSRTEDAGIELKLIWNRLQELDLDQGVYTVFNTAH